MAKASGGTNPFLHFQPPSAFKKEGGRHTEDEEETERSMSKSCSGMLEELLKCVESTECVKKNSLKQCVKDGKLFPSQCETKKQVYMTCKRGQLDMRSRLRGNKGY